MKFNVNTAIQTDAPETDSSISDRFQVVVRTAFKKKPAGLKFRQQLYADLFLLLNSGLDLRYTLQILCDDAPNQKHKSHLLAIKTSVVNGVALSKALRNQLHIDDFEFYSIEIGEETGKLATILNQLALFFESRMEQRRQMIGALSYPVMVLLTAFGAVFFMLTVVVPLFQDVFDRFGKELPALTRLVISASDVMSSGVPIVLIVATTIIAVLPLLRNNQEYRRISALFLLNIPLFGTMIRKMYLLRLVSAMELMLSSKTNLVRAIQLCQKMISFYPIQTALFAIENDIIKGETVANSFSKHKLFDNRFLTLIKVGEEVNKLPDTFLKLKSQLQKDLDHFSSTLGKILEPLIIIFIGFFVGAIIIAMYLPMFELSTLF